MYPFIVAFTHLIRPIQRGFAFKLVSENLKEESEMRDGAADIVLQRRVNEMARQALYDGNVEVLNKLVQMSQNGESKDKEIINSALKKAASELIRTETETNLIDPESNGI
jgi:hypothetical protein